MYYIIFVDEVGTHEGRGQLSEAGSPIPWGSRGQTRNNRLIQRVPLLLLSGPND